jgi:hypothetical protein
MPISPSYTWFETDSALEVSVNLPGASRSKSDVFATDCMLKVNSPPFLLLLDLLAEVDDSKSAATLTADGVRFRLHKVCQRAAAGCCKHVLFKPCMAARIG